jgi:hypothetical protein
MPGREAPGAGGEALRLGISIVPLTETLDRGRELVRLADDAGLELVGI